MDSELLDKDYIDKLSKKLGFSPQDVSATVVIPEMIAFGSDDPLCTVELINNSDDYRVIWVSAECDGEIEENKTILNPHGKKAVIYHVPDAKRNHPEIPFAVEISDCFNRVIGKGVGIVTIGEKKRKSVLKANISLEREAVWDGKSPLKIGAVSCTSDMPEREVVTAEILVGEKSLMIYTLSTDDHDFQLLVPPSFLNVGGENSITVIVRRDSEEIGKKTAAYNIKVKEQKTAPPIGISSEMISSEFVLPSKAIDVHKVDDQGRVFLGNLILRNLGVKEAAVSYTLSADGTNIKTDSCLLSPKSPKQYPITVQPSELYKDLWYQSNIKVLVLDAKGCCVADSSYSLKIRSMYDLDLRNCYEMWARFTNPQAKGIPEAVDSSQRSKHVGNTGYLLNDYVMPQIDLIYETIRDLKITYSNVNLGLEEAGEYYQRVRSPAKVIKDRMANCIEASILVASFLEYNGLDPVIISIPHHAMSGVIVSTECISNSIPLDKEIKRRFGTKLLDMELSQGVAKVLPFESTLIHPSVTLEYLVSEAYEKAMQYGSETKYCNIRKFREQKVNPIMLW